MKSLVGILLVVLVTSLAGAQEVNVNYNHDQDFTKYHTYAWAGNDANQIRNSILAQQAQQDIDAALMGKGLQKVAETQNPDLIVAANGGLQQQTSYTGFRTWGMGEITPEQNVVGTLIVSLYDAKAQNLVWRGVAQDTLSEKGDKNQKTVSKAVEKMFKKWPH
jgi:hypothetical protein